MLKNILKIFWLKFAESKKGITFVSTKTENKMNTSSYSTEEKIKFLAKDLSRSAFNENSVKPSFDNSQAEYCEMLFREVSEKDFGFASEIAKSVLKFKKCSEKQAYHIAKAAVENGLDVSILRLNEDQYDLIADAYYW